MKEVFRLTCLATPAAQPRQKHRAVRRKDGSLTSVNYTERMHPVQDFKASLETAALAAGLPAALLDGPIVLTARFFLPRPARLMRKSDPDGPLAHSSRPDLDNLVKAVKDTFCGVLWRDDCQVYAYGAATGKWYAEKTGRPRTELAVYQP